ncbi:transfer protein homolog TraA [Corynebacterium casei]|uniref:MobF family relaxase n=2 Tax=Corynebacterium TaxID=1716 RepID=UPI0009D3A424|nr:MULTISPECIES: MobF family relaxase [Corynebacterium]SLM89585.1 transfer protein homolog TraA [Corynebacterium casei]
MLTIARMNAHSVAYYQFTVEEDQGADSYYSEDGTKPAKAWIKASHATNSTLVSAHLGIENGEIVESKSVHDWFDKAVAPSGVKLGRAPGADGVPGFDLTFCAPKSVSLLWGLGDDSELRTLIDQAHQEAVSEALDYVSEHAGYTRRQDPAVSEKRLMIEKLRGISGVKYEHRTSRAGDPHVHSHVLLANKQLCQDGKIRTLDSKGIYHEARAAGMVYQATLREILSRKLGLEWGEIVNGCAEISGLDDRKLLADFSTRAREIDQWQENNGLETRSNYQRIAQKITRQTKDLDVSLDELETQWAQREHSETVRGFIASLDKNPVDDGAQIYPHGGKTLPDSADILSEVIAERSTFTRADVAEKVAELLPVGAVEPHLMLRTIESLTDAALASDDSLSVTPDRDPAVDNTQREGAQRFTTKAVIDEVEQAVRLATAVVDAGVSTESIKPIPGALSENQASAMRQVVKSQYRASVIVAPAGAGKTSSLKAARGAWEHAGKTVVGLAPTGKAADVMVGEAVADESMTIARALRAGNASTPGQRARALGWDKNTVVVIDEAGMVANPELVEILSTVKAAGARTVLVGDPQQYSAVKSRSGLLATLAEELPDAVELTEVFRQRSEKEREASTWLRSGDEGLIERAAQWYADHNRVHAGSVTAMLDDALAGWAKDTARGKQSLLIASTREQVRALNAAAQKTRAQRKELDLQQPHTRLSDGLEAYIDDTILTRSNDYELVTSAGDVVRNGQRWMVESFTADGSAQVRRLDDTSATVTLSSDYLRDSAQLGYASTGHSAQGATVDIARVVSGVGQLDKASVYVPMTRGRDGNFLYITEEQPGDSETGHGKALPKQRREPKEYARELLTHAVQRDRGDATPHTLYGQARRDWALNRLLTGAVKDPFKGTAIAAYMKGFEQRRSNRFHAHFDMSPELLTEKSSSAQGGTREERIARRHTQFLDERAQAQQQRDKVAEQLTQEIGKLNMLQERDSELSPRLREAQRLYENAQRKLSSAQSTQQSRGLFKKIFYGASDQHKVDELAHNVEHAGESYGELTQQNKELVAEYEVQREKVERLREQEGELSNRIGGLDSMLFLTANGSSPYLEDTPDLLNSLGNSQSEETGYGHSPTWQHGYSKETSDGMEL